MLGLLRRAEFTMSLSLIWPITLFSKTKLKSCQVLVCRARAAALTSKRPGHKITTEIYYAVFLKIRMFPTKSPMHAEW